MDGKVLGKIKSAEFGFVRDYPFLIGLQLYFSLDGGSAGIGCGGKYTVNISKECEWTSEEERNKVFSIAIERVAELLNTAKVKNVSELVGKPVEVNITKNSFESFRILTEVL